MKKTTLLTFALIAISFASCQLKKDRVCTCTDVDGSIASVTYFDCKKSNAEYYCSGNNTQYEITDTQGVTKKYERTTCELE